jgi:lipoprotein signal peptidase
MSNFRMTQNAGIAFRLGSSLKRFKPHMSNFRMTQNAGIAFRLRSSFKET